jgi:glycosyltransferase involved in cell wall biosynthesis
MGHDILIVGPSRYFLSGISYYTIRLANALSEDNNVSVVCMRKLLPEFLFPGRDRVGRHISDLEFSSSVNVFDEVDYNNPFSWKRACNFIAKAKPEAMVVQWWTSSVAHMLLIMSRAGKKARSRVVLEMHEVVDPIEETNPLLRLYSRLSGRFLFPLADRFVTHSRSDKTAVSSIYKIDENDVDVIPHALYDQYCNQVEQNTAKKELGLEGKFVILSFGLIRAYKGVPHLVEAFSRLPRNVAEESSLLIVGEIWDDADTLTSAIERSPHSNDIELVNEYVPDSDIPRYFSASDVVCLPYLRASQSGVAHIAASFGKPVVVSSVGGLRESMASYSGTMFVPPADPNAMVNQMTKVFNTWKSGQSEGYPPPEARWEKTVKLYEEILGKDGSPMGTTESIDGQTTPIPKTMGE